MITVFREHGSKLSNEISKDKEAVLSSFTVNLLEKLDLTQDEVKGVVFPAVKEIEEILDVELAPRSVGSYYSSENKKKAVLMVCHLAAALVEPYCCSATKVTSPQNGSGLECSCLKREVTHQEKFGLLIKEIPVEVTVDNIKFTHKTSVQYFEPSKFCTALELSISSNCTGQSVS